MIFTVGIGTTILSDVCFGQARQLAAITGNELGVDHQHDVTQGHLVRIYPLAIGIADTAAATTLLRIVGAGTVVTDIADAITVGVLLARIRVVRAVVVLADICRVSRVAITVAITIRAIVTDITNLIPGGPPFGWVSLTPESAG